MKTAIIKKRGIPLKFSKEFEAKICYLYSNDKLSGRVIGQQLGISYHAVFKILRKYQIRIRTSGEIKKVGENASHWKGGIIVRDGYTETYKPEHPRARGNYIKLSVLIAEQKIGCFMKKNEIAHHIDGSRNNDSPKNIMVVTQTEHKRLHGRRSDVSIKKVEKLYKEENLAPLQISKTLNCSLPTIYCRLKELGIVLLPGSFNPALKTEDMVCLRKQGKNLKEIGEILNCRGNTVKARLRKVGVL